MRENKRRQGRIGCIRPEEKTCGDLAWNQNLMESECGFQSDLRALREVQQGAISAIRSVQSYAVEMMMIVLTVEGSICAILKPYLHSS